MEVILNVNAQRSDVRSIAWLGRLRWLLVREVKIEQNEFFEVLSSLREQEGLD